MKYIITFIFGILSTVLIAANSQILKTDLTKEQQKQREEDQIRRLQLQVLQQQVSIKTSTIQTVTQPQPTNFETLFTPRPNNTVKYTTPTTQKTTTKLGTQQTSINNNQQKKNVSLPTVNKDYNVGTFRCMIVDNEERCLPYNIPHTYEKIVTRDTTCIIVNTMMSCFAN